MAQAARTQRPAPTTRSRVEIVGSGSVVMRRRALTRSETNAAAMGEAPVTAGGRGRPGCYGPVRARKIERQVENRLRSTARGGPALLDGHGFGQVAGLVDVAAAADRDVVGQQLQ